MSIIIATSGRPSIRRTVGNLAEGGFARGDELIVVGDGRMPGLPDKLKGILPEKQMRFVDHPPTDAGHRAGILRNRGMREAEGTTSCSSTMTMCTPTAR